MGPKFRTKYTFEPQPWGSETHQFSLRGPKGGVHMTFTKFKAKADDDDPDAWSAGLEFHFPAPPEYRQDTCADHTQCWLLGTPCWHEGTSLYPKESILPEWLILRDPKAMLRRLEREYADKFEYADRLEPSPTLSSPTPAQSRRALLAGEGV